MEYPWRVPPRFGASSPRSFAMPALSAVAVAAGVVTIMEITLRPSAAAGADVPEAVVTSYDAPAGCPDRERFVAMLRSYLDPADVPETLPSFAIRFSTEGGPRGVLRLRARSREGDGERTVEARTCDEAALALAYVAALAISPNARSGLGPPVVASPTPPASSSAAPPAAVPSGRAGAPVPAEPEAPLAPLPTSPLAPVAVDATPPPRWLVSLGLFGERGSAPGFAPGLVISGERRLGGAFVGVDLLGSRRATDPPGAGDATFTLLAARLFACPFSLGRPDRLGLSACAAFAVGRLGATSNGLDRTASSAEAWLLPGARLRGRLGLGAGFGLALTGDLGAPLVRPTYRFDDPSVTVHEVPAVAFSLGLSLARFFP